LLHWIGLCAILSVKVGDQMTGTEKRIMIFEETMRTCADDESLRSAVSAAIAGQYIIWQEEDEPQWLPRFDRPAARVISRKRSFEAACPYARAGKKVCVLNFASSVCPAGV